MHRLLPWLLVLVCPIVVHGQTTADQNRAKATYLQAEQAFEKQQFDKALQYLSQTEDLLGSSNARIESLRVRTFYEDGQYALAKTAVERFFMMRATPELALEMMQLEAKILDSLAEETRRREQAESAARREEAERLARLESEKAAEAARLRAEKAAAAALAAGRARRAELTAAQIIERHLHAIDPGGTRQSIHTMMESFAQGLNGQPKNSQVVRYSKRPDIFRSESSATYGSINVTVTVLCDGDRCWTKTRSADSWSAAGAPGGEIYDFRYQLAPLASLIDAGEDVRYRGEVLLDGEPYFLFAMTNTSRRIAESRYYLDVESYLLEKIANDHTKNVTQGEVLTEYRFSDYRATGDLLLPFERSIRTVGISDGQEYDVTMEFQMEEMQLNPTLEESLFTPTGG